MTDLDLADTAALYAARLLDDAIAGLDPEATSAIDTGDVEELAHLHVALTKASQRLATIRSTVEQALVDVMPDKRIELDGLPVLERRQGTDRKQWDHDRLVPVVVRKALDPDGAGEFPADPFEVMDRVVGMLTKVYPFTPSTNPRVTELRALDIDPDEWCETRPGRQSIQIHEEAAR